MASLQKIKAKRTKAIGRGASASHLWQKQFTLPDGRRTTLRLGLLSISAANEISGHIDHLLEAAKHGTRIDAETHAWLRSTDRELVEKLHGYGLCPRYTNPSVAEFTQAYIDSKALKSAPRTVTALSQSRSALVAYLGTDKRMDSVSAHDAMEFYDYLLTKSGQASKGVGENTAKGMFSKVRQMFNGALERDVIGKNPFKLASLSVSVGAAKKEYVPESTIMEAVEYCTTDEWKLLLVFGRFVGLRIPSEIDKLTWADINWEKNTMLIHSPKTERRGKPSRLVPLFPEIRPFLEKQFAVASESTEVGKLRESHVFPKLRKHTNVATTAKKFVKAAGFVPWDKFWNALRASRETDLMDLVGLRRACQWIGNTPKVAMTNYALMKSSDYIDAGSTETKSDAKSDAALPRTGGIGEEQPPKDPCFARVFDDKVAEAGVEPARTITFPGF